VEREGIGIGCHYANIGKYENLLMSGDILSRVAPLASDTQSTWGVAIIEGRVNIIFFSFWN
jgi:hypothetical protein